VKRIRSVRTKLEELKSIPIWDHFYCVALNTIGLLLKTNLGNIYVLVAIDHYLKWCETKTMLDHDAKIVVQLFENEVICRFGIPKYVLTDNGSKWVAEFNQLCKNYEITHQYTTPQWSRCNGMA